MSDDVSNEGGIFTPLFYVVEAAEAAIKAKLEERRHGVLDLSTSGAVLKAAYPVTPRWQQALDTITKHRSPGLRYWVDAREDRVVLALHCKVCRRDHVAFVSSLTIARSSSFTELGISLIEKTDALAASPCESDAIDLGPAGAQ